MVRSGCVRVIRQTWFLKGVAETLIGRGEGYNDM
jgi:hypothetical protein